MSSEVLRRFEKSQVTEELPRVQRNRVKLTCAGHCLLQVPWSSGLFHRTFLTGFKEESNKHTHMRGFFKKEFKETIIFVDGGCPCHLENGEHTYISCFQKTLV